MKFKEALNTPCGLRYMYDTLPLRSGAGRRLLLESEMMTGGEDLTEWYGKLGEFFEKVDARAAATLQVGLARLRDIRTTVANLAKGAVLDDVEFFEVKGLLLLAGEVGETMASVGISLLPAPALGKLALRLLDPEGQGVPSFHVYDSYSPELASLREKMRRGDGERDELMVREQVLEEQIRRSLSAELRQYANVIWLTLEALAEADLLLAQSLQMKEMGLVFPEFTVDSVSPEHGMDNQAASPQNDTGGRTTEYEKMFHPQVRERLRNCGSDFQPIDIEFGGGPVTIIGANMGGKTVALKTVGLCQLLFQFGFGIPALGATIDIKEEVVFCMGEEDMSARGLSAFASEVVCLGGILTRARQGRHVLALVDEPAGTTNPVEGTALVEAFIATMEPTPVDMLLTTHYNLKGTPGRKYRVRGLENGRMNYSLEETTDTTVPREAVTIARSLGADPEWLSLTETILARHLNREME